MKTCNGEEGEGRRLICADKDVQTNKQQNRTCAGYGRRSYCYGSESELQQKRKLNDFYIECTSKFICRRCQKLKASPFECLRVWVRGTLTLDLTQVNVPMTSRPSLLALCAQFSFLVSSALLPPLPKKKERKKKRTG